MYLHRTHTAYQSSTHIIQMKTIWTQNSQHKRCHLFRSDRSTSQACYADSIMWISYNKNTKKPNEITPKHHKPFIALDKRELCYAKLKRKLHCTRGITPKRVTSGRDHLYDIAPGQHSSEETPQRWRLCVRFTGRESKLRPPASTAMCLTTELASGYTTILTAIFLP